MIAEHYRWNGEKASHLKGFGNFLFSKFLGNSIDEIAACRGSNRIWTSVFPYSSGFLQPAPFFRGLRRLDFRKIGEKSFTKLWALDCWFSRTKSSAWTAPCQVDKARNKNYAEDSITCRILCVIILLKLQWIPPVSYSQAFSGTCHCYKSQYMRRSSSAEFRNPRNDRGNTF